MPWYVGARNSFSRIATVTGSWAAHISGKFVMPARNQAAQLTRKIPAQNVAEQKEMPDHKGDEEGESVAHPVGPNPNQNREHEHHYIQRRQTEAAGPRSVRWDGTSCCIHRTPASRRFSFELTLL
jgi:hypothetical protein